MKEKKSDCSKCGSGDVIPIIRGYPSRESLEMEESGEIKIGGINLGDDKPGWHCNACGHEWK